MWDQIEKSIPQLHSDQKKKTILSIFWEVMYQISIILKIHCQISSGIYLVVNLGIDSDVELSEGI